MGFNLSRIFADIKPNVEPGNYFIRLLYQRLLFFFILFCMKSETLSNTGDMCSLLSNFGNGVTQKGTPKSYDIESVIMIGERVANRIAES